MGVMKCSSMAIVFMCWSLHDGVGRRGEIRPSCGFEKDPARVRIAQPEGYDNCAVPRMVLGCSPMAIFRWRFRKMKLGEHERELRAAGDMLEQLRPRRVLRDARDLALKFQRDEVFREYVLGRIWAVLAMVLVFVFVSTVCSI